MPTTAITPTTPTTTAQATQSLSDNFDTFLTLLTAQIQNQDPLSPMDSAQFTQQLVQFSQVEQQIRTNENLESMLSQNQAAAAALPLSYLGRAALLDSPHTTLPGGGEASWTYALTESPAQVTLNVRDAAGRIVFTAEGPAAAGSHTFTWDGRRTNGGEAPPGVYELSVSARDDEGDAIAAEVTVMEIVSGIDLTAAQPRVITQSGPHDLDDILGILAPPS